jgi:hypothetical protein
VKVFAEPCNVIYVQLALASKHLRDDTRGSKHVNQVLLLQAVLVHEKPAACHSKAIAGGGQDGWGR